MGAREQDASFCRNADMNLPNLKSAVCRPDIESVETWFVLLLWWTWWTGRTGQTGRTGIFGRGVRHHQYGRFKMVSLFRPFP